ncbi:MAG TPA: hypothetical protein VNJ70_06460 [Thermoanaerobaculia bacterium]|nr:hypothetical protein [Thermoanaerobaculia bacterium]
MDAFTAAVCLVAIALFCLVLLVALYQKGDLRAGANVGPTSFFVEVHEKKRGSRELPS